jgi:hypothetical protein
VKKDFDDFIITSWDFVGKPLDSASNELPLPWVGVPCFAGKFSGSLAKRNAPFGCLIHLYLPASLGGAEN